MVLKTNILSSLIVLVFSRCELVDPTGFMSCLLHRDLFDRHGATLILPGTVVVLTNVTVLIQSNGKLSGIVTPNNLVSKHLLAILKIYTVFNFNTSHDIRLKLYFLSVFVAQQYQKKN